MTDSDGETAPVTADGTSIAHVPATVEVIETPKPKRVSPYARVGARLVERGYCALPVMPGEKCPGDIRESGKWLRMPDWSTKYRDQLPPEHNISYWSLLPGAGVCLVCGAASKNVVAADIDSEDPQIQAAIRGVLPRTTVRKTGAKG